MSARNPERTLADDYLAFVISIPDGASAPELLSTLIGATLTKERQKKVCGFEINGHAGDFYYGRAPNSAGVTDLTAPYFTVGAYEPWCPPVTGMKALDNTYVMAATGVGTTAANIIVYLGDRDGA